MSLPLLDVLIAGAGPAGVATALALVQRSPSLAGRIVCLDRARFPRAKPCGGGLTGHAHQALRQLGLAVRVPSVACRTGRLVYGQAAADVVLERPVEIVRRDDFDADLVAQARARGIEIVEGEGLESFAVDAGARTVSVTTSRGRALRARVLVGADGAGSRVRKALAAALPVVGADTSTVPLRLFRSEIPAPPALQLGERMIYDFSPMDHGLRGYVWLFPVAGDRVNVGVMHYPSRHLPGGEIERLLHRTLAGHGVHLASSARGWPAWRYDPRARIAGPHLLCVGDAAGIDPLTGEGIAVGLEQGIVAADAIVRALESDDFRLAGYAAAVRAAVVGRELALDRWAAALLYPPSSFSLALSMVMFDPTVRALYAARVSGSAVLADAKSDLLRALARHTLAARHRVRRLAAAARAATP